MLSALGPAPHAEDQVDSLDISKPVLKMSQEITRVVKGGSYIKKDGLDDAWIEPTTGSVTFQARKNSHLGMEVMLSATYFAAPYHYDQPQNYTRNVSFSAPRLDASYLFGDPEKPSRRIDVGIFNCKYNEYSRDLGEYMFRTWAYPGIIATGGTYSYMGANSATLTGIRLGEFLGMFSHEFMATLETDLTPVYDLNLTYMAKANVRNILKIGGGLQIARVLSADGSKETAMKYFSHNGAWYGDAPGYYKGLENGINGKLAASGVSHGDSTRLNTELSRAVTASAVLDSVSTGQINPDMKQLGTRAIKPMIYFSFDPKPLIGLEIFGAKDLVFYGEAALLGAQNYPVFYNQIGRRIPFMLGFDFPAFKVLDVLSLEVEYYRSQMIPSFRPSQPNATPTPVVTDSYYPADWDKDDWKWSLSAERTLVRGVSLSAQLASDHSRSWDWNYYGRTPWEIYTTPSQFYWGLKLAVSI
jgi:hypothetical protein